MSYMIVFCVPMIREEVSQQEVRRDETGLICRQNLHFTCMFPHSALLSLRYKCCNHDYIDTLVVYHIFDVLNFCYFLTLSLIGKLFNMGNMGQAEYKRIDYTITKWSINSVSVFIMVVRFLAITDGLGLGFMHVITYAICRSAVCFPFCHIILIKFIIFVCRIEYLCMRV